MARGGKREGAGRPAGAVTMRTRAIAESSIAAGLTPLDYMLQILRDEAMTDESRFEAAKAAAPYVHAKLASVEMRADVNISHEEWLDQLPGADTEAPAASR